MKLSIHSQTSTVPALKLGNGLVIYPTLYNRCDYLSILWLKFNLISKRDQCKLNMYFCLLCNRHNSKWVMYSSFFHSHGNWKCRCECMCPAGSEFVIYFYWKPKKNLIKNIWQTTVSLLYYNKMVTPSCVGFCVIRFSWCALCITIAFKVLFRIQTD